MNVESLKSEIQQVLDNDVVLRKEFTDLKRSLSDYRNQLIMRDEDCKRLQVTIDVLNTKLVVIERDNTNYKAELTSFKELRGTIKDQLEEKQNEIDARLNDIQELKNNINSIAAEYETKLSEAKLIASSELERVTLSYTLQINELRTNSQYKESGIKEEYENRVSELSIGWADREQSLFLNHDETITNLKDTHQIELEQLNSNFNAQINNIKDELGARERLLIEGYEKQILDLQNNLNTSKEDVSLSFQNQINELKSSHELLINESETNHELKIVSLINEYEEKLSNTLIHSNLQNTKLNDELNRIQSENEQTQVNIASINSQLETKNNELNEINLKFSEVQNQLEIETDRFINLSGEFEAFKQNSLLSSGDQVAELNNKIENYTIEVENLVSVIEKTSNALSDTEISLELKVQELQNASLQIDELNKQVLNFESSASEKNSEINNSKIELENIFNQKLEHSETEYQKLLIENTNIIDEINIAQDKLEDHESEITLLKAELEEVKIQSAGKVDYFKEILSNRNFEITNLESNIAALNKELQLIKKEMASVCENSETISKLNVKILDEKDQLANQMLKMNSVIGSISQQVDSESINVEGLNNHRKNVILANNSDEVNGKSQMKEQINDLVREIDKCIVLLSA